MFRRNETFLMIYIANWHYLESMIKIIKKHPVYEMQNAIEISHHSQTYVINDVCAKLVDICLTFSNSDWNHTLT